MSFDRRDLWRRPAVKIRVSAWSCSFDSRAAKVRTNEH